MADNKRSPQSEDDAIEVLPSNMSTNLISRESSFNDIIDDDMKHVNFNLAVIYSGWNKVKSINTMLKMVDATMNLLERRRHILHKPYGVKTSDSSKKQTIDVYD